MAARPSGQVAIAERPALAPEPSPPATGSPAEPTPQEDRGPSGGPRRGALLALGLYLTLALLQFRATWGDPRNRWIGVDGDPPTQMWFLSWTARALSQGTNPFFSDHMNYPDGVNLMWNTSMPLLGALLAPVTWTFGPVLSWNILVTTGVVLSAWTACLLAYRYVRVWPAAAIAGLVFGFSPYMMARSFGHANLLFLALVPVTFLLIDDLLVRQQRRAGVTGALLGVVLAAQLLISEEILASGAVAAAVGLAVLVASRPAEVPARVGYVLRGLGVAAGALLALAAWPLAAQFLGPRRITGGAIHPPGVFVTDLVEFVRPTGLQHFAPSFAEEGALRFAPVGVEWNGYVGIPLLALVAWIVWHQRANLLVRVLAGIAGAMALLALGRELVVDGQRTGVPLPFRVIERVPVLGQMLSTRLMLYVFLCLGLLLAIYLGRQHATGSRRRVAVGYAVALLVLVPLVPAQTHPTSPADVPAFFGPSGEVSRIPEGAVVVVVPYTVGPGSARPLLWQAEAGLRYRMPAGYFVGADDGGEASVGPRHSVTWETLTSIQRGEPRRAPWPALVDGVRSDLARWGVGAVVVGPMPEGRDEAIELFTAVLGAPPESFGEVAVWWQADV